jgi:hypothetical protein
MQNPSQRTRKAFAYFGVTALLAMTAATAQVTSGTTGIDATGSTRSEIANCNAGNTQQDQATCLREAKNAAADKKRGVLDNANGEFAANAQQRCDVLAGEERVACQARIAGYGSTQGSVASGGVIREVETVVAPSTPGSFTIQPKTSDPVILVPTR